MAISPCGVQIWPPSWRMITVLMQHPAPIISFAAIARPVPDVSSYEACQRAQIPSSSLPPPSSFPAPSTCARHRGGQCPARTLSRAAFTITTTSMTNSGEDTRGSHAPPCVCSRMNPFWHRQCLFATQRHPSHGLQLLGCRGHAVDMAPTKSHETHDGCTQKQYPATPSEWSLSTC